MEESRKNKNLLRRRKERLSIPQPSLSPEENYLEVEIGEKRFAFPLHQSTKILPLAQNQGNSGGYSLHRYSTFPPPLLGLMSWNFSVVHVLDFASQVEEEVAPTPTYVLVWEEKSHLYGLPLHYRGEKRKIPRGEVESSEKFSFLSGQWQWGTQVVYLVDLHKFVQSCL